MREISRFSQLYYQEEKLARVQKQRANQTLVAGVKLFFTYFIFQYR